MDFIGQLGFFLQINLFRLTYLVPHQGTRNVQNLRLKNVPPFFHVVGL
jgi:hypothetical protein